MSDYSALASRGPVADAIAQSGWVMFWGATVVLALVMGLLLYAMFRDPARRAPLRAAAFVFGGGLVFPAVVLTALLIYGTHVGERAIAPSADALRVQVTAHQWWWEVRYPAVDATSAFVVRDELVMPVGRPVELTLHSADVIHSLWIPRLAGKVDLIPGRTNVHRIEASEAGDYGGQCAELCGVGHAGMKLAVRALPPAEFVAWRAEEAR